MSRLSQGELASFDWVKGMDFVAIDFETANECRNSACAIGLTRVRSRVVEETAYHLIRPAELRFADMNTYIHGITVEMVADSPTLKDLWPELQGFIQDCLLVAHNASFDLSVLRHSLHSVQLTVPRLSYLCSLKLSKITWPQLASYSLGYLAGTHGIQLDHHHAGSDSRATAALVLLAASPSKCNCLREFATGCGMTIGEIYSGEEWTPSSAPGFRRMRGEAEFSIPDGFDIATHPFHQKTMVFTGALGMFTRHEVHQIIEKLGGYPRESVSKKTDYLVAGEQDVRTLAIGTNESTKLRKAKGLIGEGCEMQLITEPDFAQLLFTPMNIAK